MTWKASAHLPGLEPVRAAPAPKRPRKAPRPIDDSDVRWWLMTKPLDKVVGWPTPPTSVLRQFIQETGKQLRINATLIRFARWCHRRRHGRDRLQPIIAIEALVDMDRARGKQ